MVNEDNEDLRVKLEMVTRDNIDLREILESITADLSENPEKVNENLHENPEMVNEEVKSNIILYRVSEPLTPPAIKSISGANPLLLMQQAEINVIDFAIKSDDISTFKRKRKKKRKRINSKF